MTGEHAATDRAPRGVRPASTRLHQRAAVAGSSFTLLLLVAAGWISALAGDWVGWAMAGVWLAAVAGVGAVVTARHTGNVVGPLLLGTAFVISLGIFCQVYSQHALLEEPGSLPGGLFVAWLALWVGTLGFGLFVLIVLLFPTGRPLSGRWRWVVRLLVANMTVHAAVFAFLPGQIDVVAPVTNPVGAEALSGFLAIVRQGAETVLVGCALASVLSAVLRYRRAGSVERQQLKWVVFAVVSFPFVFGLAVLSDVLFTTPEQIHSFAIIVLGLLAFPAAIGVAMMRYRLYDIDVVINRALVYTCVTAIIVGGYVAIVTLMGNLLHPLTAGSDLAVAASTLVVAAMFQPVRRRVQTTVDRRFYRRKYDAVQVVNGFSDALRRQVDLSSLSSELLGAVSESMQPRHVSLWVRDRREPGGPAPST